MPRINLPKPKPKRYTENRQRRHQLVYNDKRWAALRQAKLMKDPLCEDCLAKGIINGKDLQVHHNVSPFIVGLSPEDFEFYAWSIENLVTLCPQCHSARHHQSND